MRAVWMVVALMLMMRSGRAQGIEPGWSANWIQAPWSTARDGAESDGSRPMPIFRHDFVVRGKVTRAELRIAGLGQFEARLNGTSVAPRGLHEAWTDYRKTVIFQTYDVAKNLTPGANTLGIMLGNGMYNVEKTRGRYTKFEGSFGPPKLIAELRVIYNDGRAETIGTDATWKTAPGPVTFSSTYGGEDFDARREAAGWDRTGFHDNAWTAAATVDGPGGRLISPIAPEVDEFAFHRPIKTTRLGQNKVVYDLGENFAGVPNLRIRGDEGQSLKLTPGELLNADGSVSQKSSAGPVWWSYTLRASNDEEVWEPKFSYYGFRYLQAEWVGQPGVIDEISGVEWHSASPVSGSFKSSSPMLNAIHQLIVNAMHNNEVSLFTDCPHREKLGWLEETHLVAAAMIYNNDLERLYRATDKNIADAQQPDGMVPTIAPQYTKFGPKYPIYDDSPEWGSAAVLAPWTAYRFYGDQAELAKSYPVMKAYVSYLEGKATDGIVAYGLGDWYDIGPGGPGFEKNTTLGVTGTLMLYEDATAMAKIARITGNNVDGPGYEALAAREKSAFNKRFWDEAAGYYDKGSQTANAMPLALGIVPEDKRAVVLAHVVADIHAHQDHVTAGEVGYPYLLRALMESANNDVILAMMLRKDPPSYGSQIAAGATALAEAWDANPQNSQDHLMLGAGEEWFYRGLAGIDVDLSRKADERITLQPHAVTGVDWIKCSYKSKIGFVESDWKRTGNSVVYNITTPGDGIVALKLQADSRVNVSGAKLLHRNQQEAVYKVKAGTYRFSVTP